jgi:hypothetical protein
MTSTLPMSRERSRFCPPVLALLFCLLCSQVLAQTNTNPITSSIVLDAEKVIGFDFSDSKVDLMLSGLNEQLHQYQALRQFPLSNSVPPALLFNPTPVGFQFERSRHSFKASAVRNVRLPANPEDLAFY